MNSMFEIVDERYFPNEKKGIIVVKLLDNFNRRWQARSTTNPEDVYNEDFGKKLAKAKAYNKALLYYRNEYQKQYDLNKKGWEEFVERMENALAEADACIAASQKELEEMLDF